MYIKINFIKKKDENIIFLFIWWGVKRVRKRDWILRLSFVRFDFIIIFIGSRIIVYILFIDLWVVKERSRWLGVVCGIIW